MTGVPAMNMYRQALPIGRHQHIVRLSLGTLRERNVQQERSYSAERTGEIPDPYLGLGVPRGTSLPECNKAYYSICKKMHPDINKSPAAVAPHRRAQCSIDVIRDSERLAAFERQCAAERTAIRVSTKETPARPHVARRPSSSKWDADMAWFRDIQKDLAVKIEEERKKKKQQEEQAQAEAKAEAEVFIRAIIERQKEEAIAAQSAAKAAAAAAVEKNRQMKLEKAKRRAELELERLEMQKQKQLEKSEREKEPLKKANQEKGSAGKQKQKQKTVSTNWQSKLMRAGLAKSQELSSQKKKDLERHAETTPPSREELGQMRAVQVELEGLGKLLSQEYKVGCPEEDSMIRDFIENTKENTKPLSRIERMQLGHLTALFSWRMAQRTGVREISSSQDLRNELRTIIDCEQRIRYLCTSKTYAADIIRKHKLRVFAGKMD